MKKVLLLLSFFYWPLTGEKIQGDPATIDLLDLEEKTVRLSKFKGKAMILEWANFKCVHTLKYYEGDMIQPLQKKAKEKDIVWLTIVSTSQKHRDYMSVENTSMHLNLFGFKGHRLFYDPQGKLAQHFDIQVSPTVLLLDKNSAILYRGGITSNASLKIEELKESENNLDKAMQAYLEGKEIPAFLTKISGCSIKR